MILSSDEKLCRELAELLEKENLCRVLTAGGGAQGIEKAVELEPDLIVASQDNSDKESKDFFSSLQSHSKTAYIPVLLVVNGKDTHEKRDDTVIQAVDTVFFPGSQ